MKKIKKIAALVLAMIMTLALYTPVVVKAADVTPNDGVELEQAINNALDGDTIILNGGQYIIDRFLEISGKNNITIIGNGSVIQGSPLFTKSANHGGALYLLTISGGSTGINITNLSFDASLITNVVDANANVVYPVDPSIALPIGGINVAESSTASLNTVAVIGGKIGLNVNNSTVTVEGTFTSNSNSWLTAIGVGNNGTVIFADGSSVVTNNSAQINTNGGYGTISPTETVYPISTNGYTFYNLGSTDGLVYIQRGGDTLYTPTIEDALLISQDGDIVCVPPGDYNVIPKIDTSGNLTTPLANGSMLLPIFKRITLQAVDTSGNPIDATVAGSPVVRLYSDPARVNGNWSGQNLITVQAENVKVSGFTFDQFLDPINNKVIEVYQTGGFELSGCEFLADSTNTYSGSIYLNRITGPVNIHDNIFNHSQINIDSTDEKEINISSNQFNGLPNPGEQRGYIRTVTWGADSQPINAGQIIVRNNVFDASVVPTTNSIVQIDPTLLVPNTQLHLSMNYWGSGFDTDGYPESPDWPSLFLNGELVDSVISGSENTGVVIIDSFYTGNPIGATLDNMPALVSLNGTVNNPIVDASDSLVYPIVLTPTVFMSKQEIIDLITNNNYDLYKSNNPTFFLTGLSGIDGTLDDTGVLLPWNAVPGTAGTLNIMYYDYFGQKILEIPVVVGDPLMVLVNFHMNDRSDTIYASGDQVYMSPISYPTNPSRNDYTFVGWSYTPAGGTFANNNSTVDEMEVLNLYAQWQRIIPGVVINVQENYNTVSSTTTIDNEVTPLGPANTVDTESPVATIVDEPISIEEPTEVIIETIDETPLGAVEPVKENPSTGYNDAIMYFLLFNLISFVAMFITFTVYAAAKKRKAN